MIPIKKENAQAAVENTLSERKEAKQLTKPMTPIELNLFCSEMNKQFSVGGSVDLMQRIRGWTENWQARQIWD